VAECSAANRSCPAASDTIVIASSRFNVTGYFPTVVADISQQDDACAGAPSDSDINGINVRQPTKEVDSDHDHDWWPIIPLLWFGSGCS